MRLDEAPQEGGALLYFGTQARGASGTALAAAEGGELDAPGESGNVRNGGADESRGGGGSARGARASSAGMRAAVVLGRIAAALRGTPAGAEGDSARASGGSSDDAAADEHAASPQPRASRAWLASLTVSNALTAWPGVRALRHAL